MIERNNRTCIVCNKGYKYCNSCAEYAHLEPWHSIYCSDNCKDIFNTVSMYNKVPLKETKDKLDKCNLSNKENFHKNILKVINELYSVKEKVKEDVQTVKVEETIEVVEESKTVETLDEVQEENVVSAADIAVEDAKEAIDEVPVTKTFSKNRKKKKDYEVI